MTLPDGWNENSYFRYQREHLLLRLTTRNLSNHEIREIEQRWEPRREYDLAQDVFWLIAEVRRQRAALQQIANYRGADWEDIDVIRDIAQKACS